MLDSFGIGALPDAADFGDAGANTLGSIYRSKYFNARNLIECGFGNIEGCSFIGTTQHPTAAYGRMRELSRGKDTIAGHWEIAGVVSEQPQPTYPNGFPDDVIKKFESAIGRGTLCNKPYSGTVVISEFGDEHVKTGKPIVYTSADSVFQIAAHEDIIPLETLYEYCRIAREQLCGEHAVGRVIARPFVGESGNYVRTGNRRDYALEPGGITALDEISRAGLDVISVGKIRDIFAGRGVTKQVNAHNNYESMAGALQCLEGDFNGFCFINLVDFDMKYGHRNDVDGYAGAVAGFDAFLPRFIKGLKDDDLLIVTADHGCDPGDISTDHTREYVPLIMTGKDIKPVDLGTRDGFADIAVTVCSALGVKTTIKGKNMLEEVL